MPSSKQPRFEVRYPDGTQPIEFEGRTFPDLSRLMNLLKECNKRRNDNYLQPLGDSMIRVARDQPASK
jgi:hypothetical protein